MKIIMLPPNNSIAAQSVADSPNEYGIGIKPQIAQKLVHQKCTKKNFKQCDKNQHKRNVSFTSDNEGQRKRIKYHIKINCIALSYAAIIIPVSEVS